MLKKNQKSIFEKLILICQSDDFKNKLLKFNQHIFPHLYVVANLLLGMELVTYRGFTFKYLYLDAQLVTALSFLSFLIIFIQSLKKKISLPGPTKLILDFNKLAIIPLILINYLLISFDLYYYPNYVYSRFHINISNLQLMLSFNVLLLVLQLIRPNKIIKRFASKLFKMESIVNFVFFLTVILFTLPNLQTISSWMYSSSALILKTMGLSWEDKFIYLNGGEDGPGWITHYTQFVNKHVDERGVIFIPPQKESWQMEGNEYYIRWFLYPRYLVQSQDIVAPIPKEAEYILIDNGAWPGMSEYGWPRIFIPASKIKKIVFINRETREETILTNVDYDPATMSHKWGVIQLKK